MTIPSIELPARDSDHMSAPERTPESHKGILAWMGRHKLVSALAGTAMLAGGVCASPVASEWVATNIALLKKGASQRTVVWFDALKKWLYEALVPAPARAFIEVGMQTGKVIGDGVKVVIDETVKAKEDARLMAENPRASAEGFLEGYVDGAKNLAEGALSSQVSGLKALKDWFLGK